MKIFHLPDLGEGLAEAEIREWYVKEGDMVELDQPLVSMETAKAIVDVPSPHKGKIVKLHGDVNEVVATGAAFISFAVDDLAPEDQGSVVGRLEKSEKLWQEEISIEKLVGKKNNAKAMPAARALAMAEEIDLQNIIGTGRDGLITLADVSQYMQELKLDSAPLFDYVPLQGIRRTMAQAMVKSAERVVPVTIFDDADITHIGQDVDLSVRIIQAMVFAAEQEPTLNVWFDGKSFSRRMLTDINIGLAIETEAGTFVPVIKQAQLLCAAAIREKINYFKQAAKNRELQATDMQGASIILSNFGMMAGRHATPIVVPPTVAILASGRLRDLPRVVDGKVTVGRFMPLSFTFDHRAVTGAEALRFLGFILKALSM